MKKLLNISFIITLFFLGTTTTLSAQDLTPADTYYRDNIAVNDVEAVSPFADNEDDNDNPEGGKDQAEWVGGPIGDAILPIVLAGIAYSAFILVSKRRKSA